MGQVFIYMTAKDSKEAETIGRSLVEKRLAACANVLSPMTSFYWWDGKVQKDSETVLVAKTRREKVEALTKHVKSLHSYDCPCVVALPIEGGNSDYRDWVEKETA